MSYTATLTAPFKALRKFSILRLFIRCCRIASERRYLARLDDRALQDIGLTRADVAIEIERPFWDLPTRPNIW